MFVQQPTFQGGKMDMFFIFPLSRPCKFLHNVAHSVINS